MVDDIRFEDLEPGYFEKIFCLDEAQCELTNSRSKSTSPMRYLIRYLYRDFHLQGGTTLYCLGNLSSVEET